MPRTGAFAPFGILATVEPRFDRPYDPPAGVDRDPAAALGTERGAPLTSVYMAQTLSLYLACLRRMREFGFDLVFAPDVDPLADLFIETTELGARSLVAPATSWFWRLERVSGPGEGLRAVEALRNGVESVGFAAEVDAVEAHHDCLERGYERCVFYSYVVDGTGTTVPGLIADRLDPGVVVETTRDGNRQHWRLLVRPGTTLGGFHDALVGRLREGVSFWMGYLRDVPSWPDRGTIGTLPVEQRRALRAAVEVGYYESPRATTLDEIADRIGIPRSTLSYRLRNAEAYLARTYVTGDGDAEWATRGDAP